MLKYFSVKNYKNFRKELVLDFSKVGGYRFNSECINKNIITKAIIYGKNATGKTNLGKALYDITNHMVGYTVINSSRIVNADSEETYAEFKYVFDFDGNIVSYIYTKDDNDILGKETMFLDDNLIFKVDYDNRTISQKELKLIGVDVNQVVNYKKYMRKNTYDGEEDRRVQTPFFRYLVSNTLYDSTSIIKKIIDYIERMKFYTVSQQINPYRQGTLHDSFMNFLADEDNLKEFEVFLNVMGVKCKLSIAWNIERRPELFFEYNKKLIPFWKNASSGTLSLYTFYQKYVASAIKPSFLYMDEFDAFYHYEMSEKIIKYFKEKYPESQVILTTHNTNLMTNKIMRPDCLFILSTEGKITALCDATERELREGHNLEKMYISGEFNEYE